MLRNCSFASLMLLCLCVSATTDVQAQATPAAKILPSTTQGYLSIGDLVDLSEKFNFTKIGQLVAQEEIKPFIDDLRDQIESKLAQSSFQLQVSLEEIKWIRSGETALAILSPAPDEYAAVMLVDVAGNEKEAKKLLADIGRRLEKKGAKKQDLVPAGKATLTPYELPKQAFIKESITVYYTLYKNWIVATNHAEVAQQLIDRIDGDHEHSLADGKAYQEVLKRTGPEEGRAKDIVWFVNPFGLVDAIRASESNRKRGTDIAALLKDQGFDAIQGVGGNVTVLAKGYELIHRTFIYAPAIERKDEENTEKYNLAMRMLNFENSSGTELTPQSWAPEGSASYLTLTADLQNAFDMSETLVDARIKEGTFKSVMEGILRENKVDIREDIVAQLGSRVTLLTDLKMPITTTSDRWMAAVKLKDSKGAPKRTFDALQKIFDQELEGRIKEHMVGETKIWEKVPVEEEDEYEDPLIVIPGATFEDEEEEEGPDTIHGANAFTVALGHIMVSNNVEYLSAVIKNKGANLEASEDFKMVAGALEKLSPAVDSMRQFVRVDSVVRGTYELFRLGQLPEAESPFARALNRMLSEDEPGFVRDQELDGSKLPEDFDKYISPYLGFGGWVLEQEEAGWILKGCLISKDKLETKTPAESDEEEK